MVLVDPDARASARTRTEDHVRAVSDLVKSLGLIEVKRLLIGPRSRNSCRRRRRRSMKRKRKRTKRRRRKRWRRAVRRKFRPSNFRPVHRSIINRKLL